LARSRNDGEAVTAKIPNVRDDAVVRVGGNGNGLGVGGPIGNESLRADGPRCVYPGIAEDPQMDRITAVEMDDQGVGARGGTQQVPGGH